MTDEMCGRFWDAVLGIVRIAVRMLDDFLEIPESRKLIRNNSNPLELYDSDKRLLAASTKNIIGKGLKDIGITSVEEADALIANMGGGQVLVVFFGTIAIHYWQEIPESGVYKKWQARTRANADTIKSNLGVTAGVHALPAATA